jgi:hypothetical protein
VNVQNLNRRAEAALETVVEAATVALGTVVEAIGTEDAAVMIETGMTEEIATATGMSNRRTIEVIGAIETRMTAIATIGEIETETIRITTIGEIETETIRITTIGEIETKTTVGTAIEAAIADAETTGIATTAVEVTTTGVPAMTGQTIEMTIAETKSAMMSEMITVVMKGQILAMAAETAIGIETGIEIGIGSREKSGMHVFLLTNQRT